MRQGRSTITCASTAIVANGGPVDAMEGVAIQSDGKIVVAGHTSKPPSNFDDFVVARFNADGSADTSFGTGGMVITDFAGSTDSAHALAIQPDGKIVVAGTATHGSVTFADSDFAGVRYLSNGSLDARFGSGGKVTTGGTGVPGTLARACKSSLQDVQHALCASRHRFLHPAEPDIHLLSQTPKSRHRRLQLIFGLLC
jgi:uncharacterized delta-60 repeat protein